MNIVLLLTTAIAVSIDSFVCGFSLSVSPKNKIKVLLSVVISVFVMCLITNALGKTTKTLLPFNPKIIGGIILCVISVINFVEQTNKPKTIDKRHSFIKFIMAGIGVGVDGATANFSLSIMGINSIIVPVTIAFFHLVFVWLGIYFSEKSFKIFDKCKFLPPIILFCLGFYKIFF